MPSRIRIALDADGQITSGPLVSKWVYNALAAIKKKQGRVKGEPHIAYIRTAMEELGVLYDNGRPLGFRVFIWREPRGVSSRNSGYVQFLRQNGVEKPEKVKKKNLSQPRGGNRTGIGAPALEALEAIENAAVRPRRPRGWRPRFEAAPAPATPEPPQTVPWNNPTALELEAMEQRQQQMAATTEAINRFREATGLAGQAQGGVTGQAGVFTNRFAPFTVGNPLGTWGVEE